MPTSPSMCCSYFEKKRSLQIVWCVRTDLPSWKGSSIPGEDWKRRTDSGGTSHWGRPHSEIFSLPGRSMQPGLRVLRRVPLVLSRWRKGRTRALEKWSGQVRGSQAANHWNTPGFMLPVKERGGCLSKENKSNYTEHLKVKSSTKIVINQRKLFPILKKFQPVSPLPLFETGSHVLQAGLKHTIQPRMSMALNFWSLSDPQVLRFRHVPPHLICVGLRTEAAHVGAGNWAWACYESNECS